MTTTMQRQTTFTFGEVDRLVWKRTDIAEYLTACQSLKNMEVGTTGLARKRKGTSLVALITDYCEPNSHIYEFVDKDGNYYAIVSRSGGSWAVFSATTDPDDFIFVQDISGMPYQSADLDFIDYTQDSDALILTNSLYKPARIFISAYGMGYPTFTFEYLNIYPQPSYDFNTINYNATTVTITPVGTTELDIKFAGLPAGTVYDNAWVGGEIIGGGATEIDPIGYGIIETVTQASPGADVTFRVLIQIPFLTVGYSTSGSQYSIRQPAWSAALGYPAKTLFFQNRLWFANTPSLSNTIFGSHINSPINFDVGTGRDTDAIVYTIGQTDSGSILWLNAGKQLEIFSQNNEFACPQDQNIALTPASFSIRQQSSYGASNLFKPISYINDSYYINKTGIAFINFHFNGIGLTYQSTNVSVASSHLIKAPDSRALLRGSDTSQDNFVYLLNKSDDTITAFQFASEYKLAAFSPIEFQDNVELVDIVTINNSVYILKFYSLTSEYTIEKFAEDTRIDCRFPMAMDNTGLVTGLDLLNGYTVQVVYQNQDFGEYLVVGGEITVDFPQTGTVIVQIGLLYNNEVIPMYPFVDPIASPFKKQVVRLYVDYYNSLDFNINGKLVPYQTFAEIQAGLPLTPKTDTAIITPVYGWNRFDSNGVPIISITQSSPFDLQILAIGYQIAGAVI